MAFNMEKTTRKMIFIVDDKATDLTVAEETLAKSYRVVALSSASQMFSALEKLRPDLILLDVKMPDMSGFEAINQLKSDESLADIPVIFLTSLSDNASETYGKEKGAIDFINKPFTKAELLERVENHLPHD
jgi:putative two-component system response regulator